MRYMGTNTLGISVPLPSGKCKPSPAVTSLFHRLGSWARRQVQGMKKDSIVHRLSILYCHGNLWYLDDCLNIIVASDNFILSRYTLNYTIIVPFCALRSCVFVFPLFTVCYCSPYPFIKRQPLPFCPCRPSFMLFC